MSAPIYLDNAATTPVDPRVAEKMMQCLTSTGVFGNPASTSHQYGWEAKKRVEEARHHVAELIGADTKEIIWTSGATESDNLAIKGVAYFHKRKGNHIITSQIEHKAVLDTCRFLTDKGFEVSYIKPQKNGVIDVDEVKEAIRDETILISIMHVNNEIGTIQDIASIGNIARERGIVFHVDAAQSAGKIEINIKEMNVDLLSLSAHKICGPKGIGALFVRRQPKVRLEAQMHGGGHECGLRSGTLPTHQIVGMGEAFRLAKLEGRDDAVRVGKLKKRLWSGVKEIEEVYLNGDLDHTSPYILNVSFNFVEGESLMMALREIAVSSGSACTSATLESSYVLKALGLHDELAHSSLRFSFGRFNTETEIDYAVQLIHKEIHKLREMSPLWDMHKAGVDIQSVDWGEH